MGTWSKLDFIFVWIAKSVVLVRRNLCPPLDVGFVLVIMLVGGGRRVGCSLK